MAFEFRFPDVGEGIVEGEIVEWVVAVGDRVAAHQTVVVMETDKAVVEIPSPVAGTVRELRGAAGERVPVGAVLLVLDSATGAAAFAATEAVSKAASAAEPAGSASAAAIPIPGGHPRRPEQAPARTVAGAPGVGEVAREAVPKSVGVVGELEEAPAAAPQTGSAPGARPAAGPRVAILPRDRQLAQQLGVDVELLRGSGPGGRVTEADVRTAAASAAGPAAVAPVAGQPDADAYGPVERISLRGVRRRIAESMVRSLATAAQVTTSDEARVGLLCHIQDKEQALAEERGAVRLTLLPFVVKAVAAALQRHPELNASLDDAAGHIVRKGYYNVGIAVETADGLLVPNVKQADQKSVLALAAEIRDLAARARQRSLKVAELKGGTFTVSNFGAIGGRFATPILNPPEVGLLGMGRVGEQAVVVEGALRAEKVLPLSLTFDHRVVDGASAQRFLNAVIGYLEDPDRLFIGA